VLRALDRLEAGDQELLRLVYWDDVDLDVASTVVGCSRATAAVRLHRARGRLAKALHPPPPGKSGKSDRPRPIPDRSQTEVTSS